MKYGIIFLSLIISFSGFAQNKKKILIVGTNVSTVFEKTNGTYLMEIAIPFNYLTKQGFEIDVVTPKGGKTALYHKGDTVKILKEIFANPLFIQKTRNSLKPSEIHTELYAAIIYPGGYGHFVDVLNNTEISEIARKIYESSGVIGSLGHGTADLLNIRLGTGEYFVKNKTMTCFPTWCEKEFMTEANYGKQLPVDMESELTKRGAILKVCTTENRKTGSDMFIVDENKRLVTASFADGGEFVAKEILRLLKK